MPIIIGSRVVIVMICVFLIHRVRSVSVVMVIRLRAVGSAGSFRYIMIPIAKEAIVIGMMCCCWGVGMVILLLALRAESMIWSVIFN